MKKWTKLTALLLSLVMSAALIGCEGTPGPQGEQGVPGVQGAQGEKGDKGDPGAKGDKGDTGAAGQDGDKGDKGDKGDPGAKGDKGDTGAAGQDGAKGDKGDKGDPGAKGDKGDTGAAGQDGAQGEKGDTGAQGEKGDKGDTGEDGKDGQDGKDAPAIVKIEQQADAWGLKITTTFTFSDGTTMETFFMMPVDEDKAYRAKTAEDVETLAEYGVKAFKVYGEAAMQAAFDAEGVTDVVLGESVRLAATINVKEGVAANLDLGGNTLTASATKKIAAVTNFGTLRIDNGTIAKQPTGTDADKTGWCYTIQNEGRMTLGAGLTVVNETADYSSLIINNKSCKATDPAELTIEGGSYICGGSNAVKNDEYGVLTIEDGKFFSGSVDHAAVMTWGTAEINGGTFDGIGKALAVTAGTYGEDSAPETSKAVIKGGTFGTPVALWLGNYSNDPDATNTARLDVTVNGGTFDGAIKEGVPLCAGDSVKINVPELSFTVSGLPMLKEAAAAPRANIALAADIDVSAETASSIIPALRDATLDGNGHAVVGLGGQGTADGVALFDRMTNVAVKDLTIRYACTAAGSGGLLAWFIEGTSVLDNVDVEGVINYSNGGRNQSPYMYMPRGKVDLTLKNCDSRVDIMAAEGYNSVFVGYVNATTEGTITLQDCNNYGDIRCRQAAVVLSNWVDDVNVSFVLNNVKNHGTVAGTVAADLFCWYTVPAAQIAGAVENTGDGSCAVLEPLDVTATIGDDKQVTIAAGAGVDVAKYVVTVSQYQQQYDADGNRNGTDMTSVSFDVAEAGATGVYAYAFRQTSAGIPTGVEANYTLDEYETVEKLNDKYSIVTAGGETYYLLTDNSASGLPDLTVVVSNPTVRVTVYAYDAAGNLIGSVVAK